MARCETCGNDYARAFHIRTPDGREHVFDSFECAIHALAPACANCGCRILGHDNEADGRFYCCAHCARQSGVKDLVDNASR